MANDDLSRWVHTDARGLDAAIEAAMTRAMSLDTNGDPNGWPMPSSDVQKQQGAADLRAMLVASAAAWNLSSSRPPITSPLSGVDLSMGVTGLSLPSSSPVIICGPRSPEDFAAKDPSIFDAGIAILSAWLAIAQRNAAQTGDDLTKWKTRAFSTAGGANPLPLASISPSPMPASFPVLGAIAIVTGAAVLAYLAAKGIDVYERNIARESDTKRMVGLTGAATTVLANHAQLDASKGVTTPLNPSEQAVIAALVEATKKYAVPDSSLTDKDAKGSLFAGIGTLGVLAVGALVFYFTFKKG